MNGELFGHLVTGLIVLIPGGSALIAFWTWARKSIIETNGRVASIEAQVVAIETRCAERREWLQEHGQKLDAIKEDVAETKNVVTRLETLVGERLPAQVPERGHRHGDRTRTEETP